MTEAFEMTERFLEKQTTNFYSFFYSRRQPGINLGKFIPGLPEKQKMNKLEKNIRGD